MDLKTHIIKFCRLTPPFLAAILVSMSLLQYLGSGPHWSFIVNYFQGFCEKSWWSALLYFQNYINVKQWVFFNKLKHFKILYNNLCIVFRSNMVLKYRLAAVPCGSSVFLHPIMEVQSGNSPAWI